MVRQPEQGIGGVYIRVARGKDIGSMVAIHERAFPGFLMTRLGPAFLEDYYRLVQSSESGLALVAERREDVVGFVVGYTDPRTFYRLLRKQKARFGIRMLPALVRSPGLVPQVLASFRRADPCGGSERAALTELASIAVDPEYGGQGIGTRLVKSFLEEVRSRGARGVYLTTDANGNDFVNAFYVKLGFSCVRTFRAGGRRVMNEYWVLFEEDTRR